MSLHIGRGLGPIAGGVHGLALLFSLLSCDHQPRPRSNAADAPTVSATLLGAPSDSAPIAASTLVLAASTTSLTSAVSQAPSAATPSPAPASETRSLRDAKGELLDQTEDLPVATAASFRERMTLLVRAIAEDDPAVALPSFFPVEAYARVKAIAKPERDWEARLVAAFRRNIHEYHRKLGAGASQIRFERVEVPESKVKWMKPGSEGNRVGYHRVLRSKLVVTTGEGIEVPLEITSMISWRGEWYVVHLHGFD
jgi:hypothetical protein